MKIIKKLTYIFLLWICTTISMYAQYNPIISINQGINGLVNYNINNAGNNTYIFTLFGDGTFSSLNNPTHVFPPSQTGYTTETYFARAYDPNLPPKKTTQIGPVSNNIGAPTNPTINMTGEIDLMTSWATAQNYMNFYIIAFRNLNSPNAVNGCIEFHYNNNEIDVDFSNVKIYNNWVFNQSSALPSTSHSNKIIWYFSNLQPNETRYVYVPAETLVTVGEKVHLDVKYKKNCERRSINNPHAFVSLKYPHDPNFKIVNKQCLKPTIPNQQELIYTIGFFNDGEYFAENVYVEDNLPSALDASNIDLIDYEVAPNWNVKNEMLHLDFIDINLPGTNQTTPKVYSYNDASTYFSFKICTKTNLTDCIVNTASIVFDSQPIFYTNDSKICPEEDCSDYEICDKNIFPSKNIAQFDFSVFPNPASDQLNISIDFNTEKTSQFSISLLNFSGKVIKEFEVKKQDASIFNKTIYLKNISKGLYFITLKTDQGIYSKKVIIN